METRLLTRPSPRAELCVAPPRRGLPGPRSSGAPFSLLCLPRSLLRVPHIWRTAVRLRALFRGPVLPATRCLLPGATRTAHGARRGLGPALSFLDPRASGRLGDSSPRGRRGRGHHGGAPGAGGGGRGGGRRRPGQEPPRADHRRRVRHLLRGGPRADGPGQRPPGHPAAVQDRACDGDAGGAGERGQPGGGGAEDGEGQPQAGGGGAAQSRCVRRPGEPGTRQDGSGSDGPQPAPLHPAGAEGRAARAQQAQVAAAARAGGTSVLQEWPASTQRSSRRKKREGCCGYHGQR